MTEPYSALAQTVGIYLSLTCVEHRGWIENTEWKKLQTKGIPKCWCSFGSITWVTEAKVVSCVSTPTELSVHLKFPRFKISNKKNHKKLKIK